MSNLDELKVNREIVDFIENDKNSLKLDFQS